MTHTLSQWEASTHFYALHLPGRTISSMRNSIILSPLFLMDVVSQAHVHNSDSFLVLQAGFRKKNIIFLTLKTRLRTEGDFLF